MTCPFLGDTEEEDELVELPVLVVTFTALLLDDDMMKSRVESRHVGHCINPASVRAETPQRCFRGTRAIPPNGMELNYRGDQQQSVCPSVLIQNEHRNF